MKVPDPIKRIPKKLKKGLRHPTVTAMTVRFGVRIGHEAYLLRTEEITYPEFQRRTIAAIGEISGTTLGAALGGLAGAWVPGVGALLGAFAGSMVGEMVGEHVGRRSAHRVHRVLSRQDRQNQADPPPSKLTPPKRSL